MEEMRNVYKMLVGKHEGNIPLRRFRQTGEDNIKINLEEIEWEGVDFTHLG
jgi:hypothetical protein